MKKKTTIIVGAGASKEVGLPTGKELKKVIARMLDFKIDRRTGEFEGDSQIDIFKHLVRKEFYHPYGVAGSLPWQDKDSPFYFGFEPDGQQVLELSEKIKTFTENEDNEDEQQEIQIRVRGSERIIFIGFAFHPLNLKLLYNLFGINVVKSSLNECLGSTFGISSANEEVVRNEPHKFFQPYSSLGKIKLEDKECYKFFEHFRMSISN